MSIVDLGGRDRVVRSDGRGSTVYRTGPAVGGDDLFRAL
jgi:hypothetical protein